MALTCVPVPASMFDDPHVGEAVHRYTVEQCNALAQMVSQLRDVDLDREMWWAGIAMAFGLVTLTCMYIKRLPPLW